MFPPRVRIHTLVAAHLWIFIFLVCFGEQAAGDQPGEYQVKAERICSLARFVEWPLKKFATTDAPFVIGIFGADNISEYLREAIQDRRIKDRQVVIKHYYAKEELSGCHLLFISRSERDRLSSILNEVKRENVLTVGESDNFLSKGGIINLVNVAGSVRFQVNADIARRERLAVSSKLLQLALPKNFDPSNPGGASFLSQTQTEN